MPHAGPSDDPGGAGWLLSTYGARQAMSPGSGRHLYPFQLFSGTFRLFGVSLSRKLGAGLYLLVSPSVFSPLCMNRPALVLPFWARLPGVTPKGSLQMGRERMGRREQVARSRQDLAAHTRLVSRQVCRRLVWTVARLGQTEEVASGEHWSWWTS